MGIGRLIINHPDTTPAAVGRTMTEVEMGLRLSSPAREAWQLRRHTSETPWIGLHPTSTGWAPSAFTKRRSSNTGGRIAKVAKCWSSASLGPSAGPAGWLLTRGVVATVARARAGSAGRRPTRGGDRQPMDAGYRGGGLSVVSQAGIERHFEFDEEKSGANRAKQGIDFADARALMPRRSAAGGACSDNGRGALPRHR